MQIITYFQINLWPFIIEGSNGYTMFKRSPKQCVVVTEIDRRRKAEFKVYVYKEWRHLPRGTCVASLSGRIASPVVILDNEKIMILSGVDTGFKPVSRFR